MRDIRGTIKRWLIIAGICLAIAVVLAIALPQYLYHVQGRTAFADAKSVQFAARIVIMEKTSDASADDRDFMFGLSGTFKHQEDPMYPNPAAVARAAISRRLDELAFDIVFADKPDVGKAHVSFTVKNAEITGMVYQTVIGKRLFTVMYENGETKITHKRI